MFYRCYVKNVLLLIYPSLVLSAFNKRQIFFDALRRRTADIPATHTQNKGNAASRLVLAGRKPTQKEIVELWQTDNMSVSANLNIKMFWHIEKCKKLIV